jgi:hypothetical protein
VHRLSVKFFEWRRSCPASSSCSASSPVGRQLPLQSPRRGRAGKCVKATRCGRGRRRGRFLIAISIGIASKRIRPDATRRSSRPHPAAAGSLAPAADAAHNRRMPECKLCGKQLTEQKAAASIFDLRFLPGSDRQLSRRVAKFRAGRFGPLCHGCLKNQKALPPTPLRRRKRSQA